MNRNWYAVYTKPHSEKKVTALLSKKKIESFCPHNRVMTGYDRKRKMVYEPLFPSFVFVCITEAQMNEVRKTGDVVNFVYWLGNPVMIKTAEIENIAHFNGLYYNIKVEKSPVNSAGMIRITNEPALSTNGGIMSVRTAKIKLTLPSLGFTMYAESDKEVSDSPQYRVFDTESLV